MKTRKAAAPRVLNRYCLDLGAGSAALKIWTCAQNRQKDALLARAPCDGHSSQGRFIRASGDSALMQERFL